MKARMTAALAVANIDKNAKDTFSKLLELRDDPDPLVRMAAVEAFTQIGPRGMTGLFLAMQNGTRPSLRKSTRRFAKWPPRQCLN